MPNKVNQELIDAREGLTEIQRLAADASKEYAEADGDWGKVNAFGPGTTDEKRAKMRDLNAKADELGVVIDRITAEQQEVAKMKATAARLESVRGVAETVSRITGPNMLGTGYLNALRAANLLGPEGEGVPNIHTGIPVSGALNALFRTGAGAPPPEDRQRGVLVPTAEMELTIRDLIPVQPVMYDYAETFLRESTFGGTATVVEEPTSATPPEVPGATTIGALSGAQETARTPARGYAPELEIALVEVTTEMDDILAFLPVTDRQLRSIEGIASYVNMRGDRKMAESVDTHLINGNETNNLGFLRYATGTAHDNIQTTAAVSNNANVPDNLETMLRGMRLLREKGGMATAMLVTPAVWERTTVESANTGRYPLGSPMDMPGYRWWGVNVVLSDRIPTATTALIGDFAGEAAIRMMDDIMMESSNGYLDYFRRGIQAIRFRVTLGLQVFTPQRFVSLTGLDN